MIDESDITFLQAFWSRRVVVTYVLFAFNILISLLAMLLGTVAGLGHRWPRRHASRNDTSAGCGNARPFAHALT